MAYRLRITPTAQSDILTARKYYREIGTALSQRFSASVNSKRRQVMAEPFTYAIRYKNVRFAILETFPYALHFLVNETQKEVVILSLFHEKINPETWR